MKFHITITDNETGNILHDADTNAILASVNEVDGTAMLINTACNALDLAKTYAGLIKTQKQLRDANPLAAALAEFVQAETEATEETTEE